MKQLDKLYLYVKCFDYYYYRGLCYNKKRLGKVTLKATQAPEMAGLFTFSQNLCNKHSPY